MKINEVLKWANESRADPEPEQENQNSNELEDAILQSRIENGKVITKSQVMAIPTVAGCISFIANMISMLPIRLYENTKDGVNEITDDRRIALLNNDTGDTLDPVQWKRAWIRDYFIGSGGFTYINRTKFGLPLDDQGNIRYGDDFVSINYVDCDSVSILKNTNPIFKNYMVMVYGSEYYSDEFLTILRDTIDGCHNISITKGNELLMSVAYQTMKFENSLLKKGGNKKGFVKSEKKLSDGAMTALKRAFRALYSNDTENVVVLNNGLDFKESSNTSVEMQLNENKETNAKEICKLFNVLPGVLDGTGNDDDFKASFTTACMPVIKAITTSLNKNFLWECEKGKKYWDIDTTEMLKGSTKERYESYKIGIDSGILNIDEIRKKENMVPLGFDYINIGLNSVLFNPKTKEIYNPNANTNANMENLKGGELGNESKNQ